MTENNLKKEIEKNLNEILNNMTNYTQDYDSFLKKFNNRKKDIVNTYNSVIAKSMIEDAKKEYDSEFSSFTSDKIKSTENNLIELKRTINEFVQKTLPYDAINTLNMLKLVGDSITEDEALLYVNKYDNYMAAKSIYHILKEHNKLERLELLTFEEISKNIMYLENELHFFFNNSPKEYRSRILLHEQGQFHTTKKLLINFVSGEFAKNN